MSSFARDPGVEIRPVIDLDSPIIPGVGAGRIVVGSPIEHVLRETGAYFTSEPVSPNLDHRPAPDWFALYMPPPLYSTIYRSPAIDLWVKDGSVRQIGVHDDYRGKLLGVVGIGSTVVELEGQVGAWDENDDGCLVVLDLPGLVFEVDVSDAPPSRQQAGRDENSDPWTALYNDPLPLRIAWFFVFPAEETVPVSRPLYRAGRR